jgi:hypothetical protein
MSSRSVSQSLRLSDTCTFLLIDKFVSICIQKAKSKFRFPFAQQRQIYLLINNTMHRSIVRFCGFHTDAEFE